MFIKNFQSTGGRPPLFTNMLLGNNANCPEGSEIRARSGVIRGIKTKAVVPAALAYLGKDPMAGARLLTLEYESIADNCLHQYETGRKA